MIAGAGRGTLVGVRGATPRACGGCVDVLLLLVPLSLGLGALFTGAFLWSVKRGQYDDLDDPAVRMLRDDTPAAREPSRDERGPPNA